MFKLLRSVYKIFYIFLSLPKTIYFNLKYFPIDIALKLPVIIYNRVNLMQINGSVIIEGPIKLGMIRIGIVETRFFDKKLRSVWDVSGEVTFKGPAHICHGSTLCVDGRLILGKDFALNSQNQIICKKLISIGDDVMISWDTLIMDTDFHNITIEGEVINPPQPIVIGDHVWVGCRCTIMKGTKIQDNTIIAASSLLVKEYAVGNCIIGGTPAKVLKTGTEWDRRPQEYADLLGRKARFTSLKRSNVRS